MMETKITSESNNCPVESPPSTASTKSNSKIGRIKIRTPAEINEEFNDSPNSASASMSVDSPDRLRAFSFADFLRPPNSSPIPASVTASLPAKSVPNEAGSGVRRNYPALGETAIPSRSQGNRLEEHRVSNTDARNISASWQKLKPPEVSISTSVSKSSAAGSSSSLIAQDQVGESFYSRCGKGKEDLSGNAKKRKPGKNGVPDRWEDYCKIGSVVEGTNFIAFKVPLKQVILDKVTEGVDNKWSVEDVIETVPSPGLGLVIDLTFTTRYYDPKIFTSNNIEHKKILTKGHDIPDNALVDEFNEAVDEMVHSDGTKLIGVHCTHGLNRTGYLVCRYMIQKLDIRPEVAIAAFDDARGEKQERENYLNHLKAKGWQN